MRNDQTDFRDDEHTDAQDAPDLGRRHTEATRAVSIYLAKLKEIRRSAGAEQQAKNYRGPEFQDMVAVLCRHGIALPALWTDWSIERDDEGAAESLGIRSFEDFERVLVEEYGDGETALHIHKGPGNGLLMADLRASGSPLKQVGIGNALYFSLESTMQQFLSEKGRKDPHFLKFLHLVEQALRVELAKRGTVDINDIFKLLANPKSWIAGFLKPGKQFLVGGEFDLDTLETLGHEVFELFQIYLGELSPKEIRVRLNLDRLRRKKLWGHELQRLNKERRSLLKGGRKTMESDGKKRKKLKELDREIEDLEDKIASIRMTHRELGKMETHSQVSDTPLSPHQFFGKSFSTKFTKEIEQENQAQRKGQSATKSPRTLDLHRHIQVAPEGFVQGDFDDMPNLFEKESALAITGVRSDSHQDHEAFAKGIKENIELLKPGGVIATDGIRQSYSRILRLEEIRDVIKSDPEIAKDVKVEVIFDPKTQKVRSFLIQKQHPEKGFLSNKKKREMYSEGVKFLTIDEVLKNPFIYIGNDIRRTIEAQTGKSAVKDGRDAFRDVQENIDQELSRLLEELGINHVRSCKKESPVIQEIRRNIMKMCSASSH